MSHHYQKLNLMKNKFYLLFAGLKNTYETNEIKCPLKLWIIKCRTLCKSPEVNWLIICDVVQVSKIDHHFFSVFSRRSSTNSTGGQKYTIINKVMQD